MYIIIYIHVYTYIYTSITRSDNIIACIKFGQCYQINAYLSALFSVYHEYTRLMHKG